MLELDVLKLGGLYVLKMRNNHNDDWKTIYVSTNEYEFEKQFIKIIEQK